MFAYYLKSLHIYREQNLDVGNATAQACLDLISSYIEGEYLIGKAMLHQGVRTLDFNHPDLKAFLSVDFDDEAHQRLILQWFDLHVARSNHFNQMIFDVTKQHIVGANSLVSEFNEKLNRDLPGIYGFGFDLRKSA